jgi:hypothetical protein
MSRFYFVENPVKVKRIRQIPGFEQWPAGPHQETIEHKKKILVNLLEAQDRLWDKGRSCPEKMQAKINEYEELVSTWGYMRMEDMPPEMSKIIADHFWELL